jgi:hypothetical protein
LRSAVASSCPQISADARGIAGLYMRARDE